MAIKSFRRNVAYVVALGASSLALSTSAWAQSDEPLDQQEPITVIGQRPELESPRYAAPLLETPQTVTVVSAELVEQQNLLGLRDILSTLPGITFGAGEGGGGYGDSINLRGYAASNDISVDGVRDSAQYTRTDPFNLQQLELTGGANSVYGGSGSLGGSINLITKRAEGSGRTVVSGALGTDDYGRVTIDSDLEVGDTIGVRLNAMAHQNDVPGRDVERYERWGVAPSLTLGLGTDTRFSALLSYQEDDNIPQYGVPYALGPFNQGALAGVDNASYFGYANIDTQQIEAGSLAGIFEHEFSETLTVRNLTRYQDVSQLIIVDPPQGNWCVGVGAGINPWTGAACATGLTSGQFAPTGPRGNTRDTQNEILINQTDLTFKFDTGGAQHTLVAGMLLSSETYHLVTGNVLRNPSGATPNPALPVMSTGNPNNIYAGPINFIVGGGARANGPNGTCNTTTNANCVAPTGYQDNEVDNRAIYLFDRIELGDHWEVNGGIRAEQTEARSVATFVTPYGFLPSGDGSALGAASANAPAGVINGVTPLENEADLLSYRLGVVYQPVENANLYFAYGNSETPSQATVNGSCTALNCNVDPEEGENYELGVKWDVYDGRLSLTGALFSNRRSSFRVDSGFVGVQQQLDGASRVEGVALGATGLITDQWSVFANYTFLESELEQSISDTLIGVGQIDFVAGDPLPNTPEHSFSLWTTYELTQVKPGFLVGLGATYQGEYTFTRQSATTPLFYTPDYWVYRAMAAYPLSEGTAIQLNVNNLFDEEYFERVRNNATNGWGTPGAGRSITASLTYRF